MADEAGADYLGFIFVPGTPRFLSPEENLWIGEFESERTVGVFRDAGLEFIRNTVRLLGLGRVQLHGQEPDTYLKDLEWPIIRRVATSAEVFRRSRVEHLNEMGCLPLVDPGAGDGKTADWNLIGSQLAGLSFALAGGLTPENVQDAIRMSGPSMVDVSSGVEETPGKKSRDLIRDFIARARDVENTRNP